MMLDGIRNYVGAFLIILGAFVFIISVIGVYRFKSVLNRMHVAAMGDTLGLFLVLAGLIVISGLNFHSFKLALVVIFFWIASPVTGHLLARFEIHTNYDLEDECDVRFDLSENVDSMYFTDNGNQSDTDDENK